MENFFQGWRARYKYCENCTNTFAYFRAFWDSLASTSVTTTVKMERQLQIGTNSLHQEPPKVRPSLVRSRIQFFSSLNKSTSSELPFVVTATEKGHQQATIKESTQPFSFGMREKADVNRETHGKGLLDVGRGSQSGISQESLACDGQLAMSSSNLSFSTFQKMDSTSFFVRGVSIERFEEFNGYTKNLRCQTSSHLKALKLVHSWKPS